MDARLPANLEISAMIRAVEGAGGFATVIKKGDPTAGIILVLACEKGMETTLYERVPDFEMGRKWLATRRQEPEKPFEFNHYVDRRMKQDSDCWVIELDIANATRFIPGMIND